MARVVLIGNLAQLTGGVVEFDLSATSVKQLFEQLSELHPAIKPHLEDGVAVAINGQIVQESLFEPIPAGSEVFCFPRLRAGNAHPARAAGRTRLLSKAFAASAARRPCRVRLARVLYRV